MSHHLSQLGVTLRQAKGPKSQAISFFRRAEGGRGFRWLVVRRARMIRAVEETPITLQRRTLLIAGLGTTLGATALAGRAQAQAFPSKQIRFVVPFAAGGNADVTARIAGEGMTR